MAGKGNQVYKKRPDGKCDTGRPTKRTKEYFMQEFKDMVDRAKKGVPVIDDDGKKKRSPVYLKSKLCFDKDYSWDALCEAVSYYEKNTGDKQFSVTLGEITRIIENRLFEAGLSKKADSSIVRLGLTANHGRTTERREDKVSMSISEFEV